MTLEEQNTRAHSELTSMLTLIQSRKPKKKRGNTQETVQKLIDKLANTPLSEVKPTPANLVGIYGLMYKKVYGLDVSSELCGKEGMGARMMAGSFIEREFKGDFKQFAKFLVWAWLREKEREKWRIENGKGGKRMTWRMQFSPSIANEYRLSQKRELQYRKTG